ncbi:MAG: rRNA maturation RNase YbeY [Phycisphaerales bacterium]|jgi:probable rRNA maturation factor|nr:rRNA maturation RNase YbeY [Phycisphaerales bacterium]
MDDEPSYEITVTEPDHAASIVDWPPIDAAALHAAVAAALRRHGIRRACIGLAVVDDGEIARLNRGYLKHEGPTDVITFDMRDHPEAPALDTAVSCQGNDVEGEIVVSAETALRQATARGHGVAAELSLYAVHGVLHLLGYDDHGEEQAERMHRVEDEVLTSMGIGAIYGATRR